MVARKVLSNVSSQSVVLSSSVVTPAKSLRALTSCPYVVSCQVHSLILSKQHRRVNSASAHDMSEKNLLSNLWPPSPNHEVWFGRGAAEAG